MASNKSVRFPMATLAMAAIAQTVMATTYNVNGVSSPPTSYATITEALIAHATSTDDSDGLPDVIEVVVPKLLNHPQIIVNQSVTNPINSAGVPANPVSFPALGLDPLVIRGSASLPANAIVCLAFEVGTAAGAGFTNVHVLVELADTGVVRFEDIDFIPQFVAAGATRDPAFALDEGNGSSNLNGAIFEMFDVRFLPSDSSNDPVTDPAVVSANTTTRWRGDGNFATFYLGSHPTSSTFSYIFDGVVSNFGAQQGSGVGVYSDGSSGNCFITFNNCDFSYNGLSPNDATPTFANWGVSGINMNGMNGPVVSITNTKVNNNGSNGIGNGQNASLVTAPAPAFSTLTVGEGTVVRNNGTNAALSTTPDLFGCGVRASINLNSRLDLKIDGSYANPVYIANNSADGILTASGGVRLPMVDNTEITNNGQQGIEILNADLNYVAPPAPAILVTDTRIAFNGSAGLPNVAINDANTTPAKIEFLRCTLHDPLGVDRGNIEFNDATTQNVAVELTDCVVTGAPFDTDRGFRITNGTNNSFFASHASLWDLAPIFEVVAPGTGTYGSVSAFAHNPVYQSLTPATPTFLNVTNGWNAPDGAGGLGLTVLNNEGGASFVPSYPYEPNGPATTPAFPQTVYVHPYDATGAGNTSKVDAALLETTAYTGPLPPPLTPLFTWTVTNPQLDPITVAPIAAPRVASEYWTIDHNAGANDVTANVTLPWLDADLDDTTPNINIHRFNGTVWEAQNPSNSVFVDTPVAGYNSVKAMGINEFSPFAIIGNNVLAVDLVSFTATQTGSTITVEWSTAAELDNAGFVVYRAGVDGSLGEKLSGLIPAEGSATAGASYSFVDSAPIAAGETSRSYLLVDIDLSGAEATHGPATATITMGSPSSVGNWTMY